MSPLRLTEEEIDFQWAHTGDIETFAEGDVYEFARRIESAVLRKMADYYFNVVQAGPYQLTQVIAALRLAAAEGEPDEQR